MLDLMTLDVESLLGELIAWIDDPNDTSGSGQGETKGLTRGISYLDPAWYVAWRHIFNKSDSKVEEVVEQTTPDLETVLYSMRYCFHPYFAIDNRSNPECK